MASEKAPLSNNTSLNMMNIQNNAMLICQVKSWSNKIETSDKHYEQVLYTWQQLMAEVFLPQHPNGTQHNFIQMSAVQSSFQRFCDFRLDLKLTFLII